MSRHHSLSYQLDFDVVASQQTSHFLLDVIPPGRHTQQLVRQRRFSPPTSSRLFFFFWSSISRPNEEAWLNSWTWHILALHITGVRKGATRSFGLDWVNFGGAIHKTLESDGPLGLDKDQA